MRDYAKVSPQFWTGKTGRALKTKGPEAVIVAMYLMTCPNANMLGLFWVPKLYIAHETGLGIEGASKGLAWAIEGDFCAYDENTEMVWVYEMARFQIADALKPNDKQCLGVRREYNGLPENPYLSTFYERYSVAFNMTEKRGKTQGARKGLRSPYEAKSKNRSKSKRETPLTPLAGFDAFWAQYPKKTGKGAAESSFDRIAPSGELLARMLAAVRCHSESAQWRRDGGQFIPNPATWLNQRRWEDEAVTVAEGVAL